MSAVERCERWWIALGRKKGVRKEPLFGLAAALGDLRLSPDDRIPDAEPKPKKSAAKRVPRDDDGGDDEPPPERKVRSEGKSKRRSKSRFRVGRLVYWGA